MAPSSPIGVKLNPYNELVQLFTLSASGHVATAAEVFQQIKNLSSLTDHTEIKTYDPIIHESLAPSFGSLTNAAQSVKDLDDKLKLMIAVSMKELLKYKDQDALTWTNIQGCFNANTTLESVGDPEEINEQFVSDSTHDFKFNGDPDPKLVQEVMNWWASKACPDPDIRNDSKLDVESLAKIVAWTGATVTNFVDFWSKHERHEQSLLEVGVMRFPSIADPHFKIYRIKLFAWSDCSRTVWHEVDKNGIRSVVTSQKFKPNKSVLDKVKEEATKKAANEVDDMFA